MPDRDGGAGRDGRRQRGGEDEAGRKERTASITADDDGDIAAEHAKRLGQRTLDDVDPVHDAIAFAMPPPRGPYMPTAWTSST